MRASVSFLAGWRLWISAFAVVFSALHTGLAWAQTDGELRALYQRRDISRMEEIARTGDVRAEAWMGLMLQRQGRRLEAKVWWRRAAEKGNLWAIGSLARMHRRDNEYEEAARWLARGAHAGHVDSMVEYASLLLQGRGVPKDEQAAAGWYSTAAARGHKYSYFMRVASAFCAIPLKPAPRGYR